MFNMQFFLFIVIAVFALGDICGIVTKAKISGMFFTMIAFLIGFISGVFPADIIEQAGLTVIAKWAPAMMIFHLGTGVDVRQLFKEWRTVVMSLISLIATIAAIAVTAPLIGKESALVSIPIINGGLFATQIMTAGAAEKGAAMAAALGIAIYSLQKLFGTPPASYFGIKEARSLLTKYRKNPELYKAQKADVNSAAKMQFYKSNGKYYTDSVCIGLSALFAWIATSLGTFTGVNYGIWALILGSLCNFTTIVPPKILDKSKASGLLTIAIFGSIIPALAKINLQELSALAVQVVIVFLAAMLGIFIFCYLLPTWKLVGSRNMAMGIAVQQMLGFPANVIIVREIAEVVCDTEDEKAYIETVLGTSYVVAGFATVTTISVVLAGIFVEFL